MEHRGGVMRPLPGRAAVRSFPSSTQECRTATTGSAGFHRARIPPHGTLEVRSARFHTLHRTLLHSDRARHFAWRLGRNRAAFYRPGAAQKNRCLLALE
jgi:hypothetical protein